MGLLDIRTVFRHGLSMERFLSVSGGVMYFGKEYIYPDGSRDIIAANRPIFRAPGWELPGEKVSEPRPFRPGEPEFCGPLICTPGQAMFCGPMPQNWENLERARRRARAKVRRLALANEFRWFVTLTIDPAKIDSYDERLVIRRMSQWASNQAKRKGLRYILVPERHPSSGRIHFHGFFSDSLAAVDSGHKDAGGHTVYNLPEWGYGFTTAIEPYGAYQSAVGYVCKYIGKDGDKIGGRWYYSGGDLCTPVENHVDISSNEIREKYDSQAWSLTVPGGVFAGVNGLREVDD